jgi:hypothetical protein
MIVELRPADPLANVAAEYMFVEQELRIALRELELATNHCRELQETVNKAQEKCVINRAALLAATKEAR